MIAVTQKNLIVISVVIEAAGEIVRLDCSLAASRSASFNEQKSQVGNSHQVYADNVNMTRIYA